MRKFLAFVDKHYKTILLVFGVIVVILLIILGFSRAELSGDSNNKSFTTFSFSPSSAVLRLDTGEEYRVGTYEFEPGTFSGELSAGEEFESKRMTWTVEAGRTSSVSEYLLSDNSLDYAENSEADISTLRGINDDFAQKFLATYDQKRAIYDILPLDASFDNRAASGFPSQDLVAVTISDGNLSSECSSTLCLLVQGTSIDESKVAEVLSENGFDINNYKVIYSYEHP